MKPNNPIEEELITRFSGKTFSETSQVHAFLLQAVRDAEERGYKRGVEALGEYCHTRYLGCTMEEKKWHYSYDSEVIYMAEDYLKSLLK